MVIKRNKARGWKEGAGEEASASQSGSMYQLSLLLNCNSPWVITISWIAINSGPEDQGPGTRGPGTRGPGTRGPEDPRTRGPEDLRTQVPTVFI